MELPSKKKFSFIHFVFKQFNLRYPGGKFSVFQENYPNTHKRNDPNGLLDAFNIPTKQTTIPYKNEKIVFYE